MINCDIVLLMMCLCCWCFDLNLALVVDKVISYLLYCKIFWAKRIRSWGYSENILQENQTATNVTETCRRRQFFSKNLFQKLKTQKYTIWPDFDKSPHAQKASILCNKMLHSFHSKTSIWTASQWQLKLYFIIIIREKINKVGLI